LPKLCACSVSASRTSPASPDGSSETANVSTIQKSAIAEYENPKSPAANPLRDDHLVLLTIDRLLALHAAFKRWHKRKKTLRALADLDEHQLRDIGLTRDDAHYEALAELEDAHSKRINNKVLGGRK
jgi:uncharacterized protein YjiS (DUF1127 family)